MAKIFQLAISNIMRRPLRSATTAAGVAIAVAALFSLSAFQRGYQSGLRGEMDRLGAQVLVVPKGCPYDAASMALHGATWPCYLKSAYLAEVRATPHVATAAPVLMSALFDRNSGSQIVYCGVDSSVLPLKTMWRINGQFPVHAGQILVGAEMARQWHWSVGQHVALPGLPNHKSIVSGIIAATGGADDLFIFLPLTEAQKLLNRPGALTHILVRLDAAESLDSVVNNLRGCDAGLEMNVVPLAHIFHSIQNLVANTRMALACVVLVALVAAAAGVSNTVLMAITERTREIGVLRALGFTRAAIFVLIWLETVVLCLAGGLAGIVFAALGAKIIETWLRGQLPFTPSEPLIRLEWPVVLLCMACSLFLGTIASLGPARRAACLSPAEAMRR